MLGLLRSQSRSAAGAITYVTIGVLMMIWAGLCYYFFVMPDPNPAAWQKFACVGTILSGFAIGTIGLLFGLIGGGAKAADTTSGVAATGTAESIVEVPPVSRGGNAKILDAPIVTAIPSLVPTVNSANR